MTMGFELLGTEIDAKTGKILFQFENTPESEQCIEDFKNSDFYRYTDYGFMLNNIVAEHRKLRNYELEIGELAACYDPADEQ